MNELKNKSTIMIIIALIVVCGGSFLGVRAMNNSIDTKPTDAVVNYIPDTTTTTTTAPVIATGQPITNLNNPATLPTATTGGINLITTFPMVSGGTTTTEPTTAYTTTTTMPTTTETTTARPLITTTKQQATTQKTPISDSGLAGYLFNSAGDFFFTADDPWQRNYGYTEAFDVAAPFVSIYMDTMRAKFRYNNKDWMVQFWKGQYGLAFIGSEIGVYTKPLDRTVDHYDAANDDDALYMACTCYRNGQIIFSREYGKYWWCTGFIPGQLKNFSDRSELAVKCRITMKDSNMLLAFCDALKAKPNNLIEGKHFAVSGLDVFITWQ